MSLSDVVQSKDYQDVSLKIAWWRNRIQDSNETQVLHIKEDISNFFLKMQKDKPKLYSLFQGQHSQLSEIIYQKLTGRKATFD
ncbi:Uncharacterised protein [Candidatus Bilamarchaeum dharawalense]|uniref:Uncharacterized protein n=1 Tax=Candidatus Bilamarchaeum dharawalense TaxID=2885759 RepID=A0A5E4LN86_9ARCH|nr:Uncharacterised protein [Candidatus Bilamarchaeum dharawalense]